MSQAPIAQQVTLCDGCGEPVLEVLARMTGGTHTAVLIDNADDVLTPVYGLRVALGEEADWVVDRDGYFAEHTPARCHYIARTQ